MKIKDLILINNIYHRITNIEEINSQLCGLSSNYTILTVKNVETSNKFSEEFIINANNKKIKYL